MPASFDATSVSENSRRLIADLQRFLNEVEPIVGNRPLPQGPWYAELQDACNQAHYLWSRLEILQHQLLEDQEPGCR